MNRIKTKSKNNINNQKLDKDKKLQADETRKFNLHLMISY